MHQQSEGIETALAASASMDRTTHEQRWPPAVSSLFVIGMSLALWGAIYVVASVVFG